MKNIETINYTLRVPKEIYEKIRELAELENRSIQKQIVSIFESSLFGKRINIPISLYEKLENTAAKQNMSTHEKIIMLLEAGVE